MTNSPTLAVVLAAGGGTRFSGVGHKLLAELDGSAIVARAVQSAVDADIGPVLVITGAAELDEALGQVRLPDTHPGLHRAHNEAWALGQATSLRVAASLADRFGYDAMVVGLGDQPFIEPTAWRRVADSSSPIAVARYERGRRTPVRLDRSVWPDLPREGDEGARVLMRLRPDLVEEIPCAGSPADIDTMEELEAWQNRSSTNSR